MHRSRIEPARCDGEQFISDSGTISERNAQEASQVGKTGILQVRADGSGEMVTKDSVMEVKADGSGHFARNLQGASYTLTVNAGGSGEYVGPEGTFEIDGKGGGQWVGKLGSVEIHADGSGTWVGEKGILTIHADGSGSWSGEQEIINHGDGTGTIDDKAVRMSPWTPPPRVAKIDLLRLFKMPGQVCGYVIRLNDRVLFDFDQYAIRSDAAAVLNELAKALQQVNAKKIEIRGHTDNKGADDYNQTLSEKRAASVQQALQQRVALPHIEAHGYGETQPIAPNEVDGKDAPANRQLNRRVEIFVRL